MSAEEFAEMLREIDLTDPDQQSVAVNIASKIADRPEAKSEEEEAATEEEEEDKIGTYMLYMFYAVYAVISTGMCCLHAF